MWCRNGLQVDIADATDINKNTSSAWNFDLRIATQDYLIENREMLDGHDDNGCSKTVELMNLFFLEENTTVEGILGQTWCLEWRSVVLGNVLCLLFQI
jgi:hypothetical protein